MAADKPKRTRRTKAAAVEIEAIKGFDSNLACRDFQYEIGGTYEHQGRVEACESGFHSVECPFDVFQYYPASTSRYAIVRASGEIARHDADSKIASARLYVEAELKLPELIKRGVGWLLANAKTKMATGDRGHAAATGDSGHAAATGDSGHAAATGDRGHAETKGKGAIAASLGACGSAKAEAGGAIMLAYYDTDQWPYRLKKVAAFMVGEGGIEAGKTYRLNANGQPEQVSA